MAIAVVLAMLAMLAGMLVLVLFAQCQGMRRKTNLGMYQNLASRIPTRHLGTQ